MKVLITGASSGIGRDMTKYLDSMGCDLYLVSSNKDRLEEVQKQIKGKCKVLVYDLSLEEDVYKLYDDVKNEGIDFLINNAGFGLFGNTWETDLDREIDMIKLNIVAVHILSKLFLTDMVKKDKGRILNVASSAGFLAGPGLNTYYGTKNYVTKWTMGIYEELRAKGSNVVVSCLCPGPVNTNFNKVAGGKFLIKGLSSEYTAKYGIDMALKNKLIIIPGVSTKLGVFLNRFIPWTLSLKIVHKIQKKKSRC